MDKSTPETVAAVDLGSNSFHMIVSRLQNGQLKTIDRMREMVRLAAGLDRSRCLTDDARQRAIDCLERFGQRLKSLPHGSVRAVGTNTLRSATNSAPFLQLAQQALGHPIEIISGIEEARLIYAGVAQSLEPDENRRLVIDVGGGSTEFIIGSGNKPLKKASLHMGCVSMSNACFADGRITRKRMKSALISAQQELENIRERFSSSEWQAAIGASGTLRAVARTVEHFGWSKGSITRESLDQLVDMLVDAGDINRLEINGFNAERLPVFPGGVAIVHAAFRELGIERMQVADGALREGVLLDLLGRIYDKDIRDVSVKKLAERYHINAAHAEQINSTLRYCLDRIPEFPGDCPPDDAWQWLQWAAWLHEIGFDIAHSKYHRHSAYIIENADLAGFSRQEQKLLSVLVRLHRRKIVGRLLDDLHTPWNTSAKTLLILLRLAVVLNRSRHPDAVPEFEIEMDERRLRVTFPFGWLDEHPLTRADLKQEAEYLYSAGIRFDFH